MGVVRAHKILGELNVLTGNISNAEKHSLLSLENAKKINSADDIQRAAKVLYIIYSKQKRPEKALKMYEMHIKIRDSLLSKQNEKLAISKQFQYEYEKKSAEDSVKVIEEKKVVVAQLKQEKTQRFALYGGLTLVGFFAIFMFNRFKVTQKQKNIIEQKEKEAQKQNLIITEQKHLVEEKHKEITDSINYAERIQRSFLATKELLDANLKEYFVLFKPKDVVSGDFYWAVASTSSVTAAGSATVKTSLHEGAELVKALEGNGVETSVSSSGVENFILVTADSTGHGVPGAIMSLLNITSIESAIKDGHKEPSIVLNETRKTIIERLKKDGSAEGGKDGMDCSICVYDFKNMKLFIAAANNPVWIVRAGDRRKEIGNRDQEIGNKNTNTYSLIPNHCIEIKPDKMPVGKHDKDQIPFTLHEVQLQKGDVVYTLTDGFPDQFGGEKGKKFMSKNLRELLAANAYLPMQEQKQLLEKTFADWVGDMDQVDDVTIIGVRV